MELAIERATAEEVPVAHRAGGAQTAALVSQLVAFGQSSKKGEAFKVNTDNVLTFTVALRLAATELDSGVSIRYELEQADKVTKNRKNEEVIDLKQPGRVFFWFKDKRAVKEGAKRPGRKPASAK